MQLFYIECFILFRVMKMFSVTCTDSVLTKESIGNMVRLGQLVITQLLHLL